MEDSSRASPSTAEFTKMDVGEGGQRRGTNVCGCPPSASLYIGGERGGGALGFTPRGGGQGRWGGGGGQGARVSPFPPPSALPPTP